MLIKDYLQLGMRVFLVAVLAATQALAIGSGYASDMPGKEGVLSLTAPHEPATLRGIRVFPDRPFHFEFILDTGQANLDEADLKAETARLLRYFLAALTIPEKDLWVNLSPYEQDRIVPPALGRTEMGQNLLAQDYLLKQMTASLMYPERELGAGFWQEVYRKARQMFGTSQIPVDTFNKVWIVPEEVSVREDPGGPGMVILDSRLKVLMEEDYLATRRLRTETGDAAPDAAATATALPTSEIVGRLILPELMREVNEGKTFAPLRQIYHAVILASWYKMHLRESILSGVYVDRAKTQGIEIADPDATQQIYEQYLASFRQGVYNYVKEELDPHTNRLYPRKYFSGGTDLHKVSSAIIYSSRSEKFSVSPQVIEVDFVPRKSSDDRQNLQEFLPMLENMLKAKFTKKNVNISVDPGPYDGEIQYATYLMQVLQQMVGELVSRLSAQPSLPLDVDVFVQESAQELSFLIKRKGAVPGMDETLSQYWELVEQDGRSLDIPFSQDIFTTLENAEVTVEVLGYGFQEKERTSPGVYPKKSLWDWVPMVRNIYAPLSLLEKTLNALDQEMVPITRKKIQQQGPAFLVAWSAFQQQPDHTFEYHESELQQIMKFNTQLRQYFHDVQNILATFTANGEMVPAFINAQGISKGSDIDLEEFQESLSKFIDFAFDDYMSIKQLIYRLTSGSFADQDLESAVFENIQPFLSFLKTEYGFEIVEGRSLSGQLNAVVEDPDNRFGGIVEERMDQIPRIILEVHNEVQKREGQTEEDKAFRRLRNRLLVEYLAGEWEQANSQTIGLPRFTADKARENATRAWDRFMKRLNKLDAHGFVQYMDDVFLPAIKNKISFTEAEQQLYFAIFKEGYTKERANNLLQAVKDNTRDEKILSGFEIQLLIKNQLDTLQTLLDKEQTLDVVQKTRDFLHEAWKTFHYYFPREVNTFDLERRSVSRFFHDLVDGFEQTYSSPEIVTNIEVAPGLEMTTDYHLLADSLRNFIKDAYEALRELSDEQEKKLTVSLQSAEDSSVLITIVDTGPGISIENLRKIRQATPFTTKVTGHGYGLVNAIRNIRSLGGEVKVTSSQEMGRGTYTVISLPLHVYRNKLFEISRQSKQTHANSALGEGGGAEMRAPSATAMVGDEDAPGGIDLDPQQIRWQRETGKDTGVPGPARGIAAAAVPAALRDAAGFVPVNVVITPFADDIPPAWAWVQ